MAYRYTRLKFKRHFRSRKKQVEGISFNASKQLDRHIFRRWNNIKVAQRFAVGWVSLLILLIVAVAAQTVSLGNSYLVPTPVAGGVYTEGIVGTFNNANPIYAVNDVDVSVSKLIFSSLLTYNSKNELVGDLASSWQVDEKGSTYIIQLKPNLFWHDNQPLTSDDIVFTYATIQNPDTKSPIMSNWAGIKVEKLDKLSVKFILPNAFSPFPHSLTNGIIPEHILKNVTPMQMRSVAFNTKSPIGSGPFKWQGVIIGSDSDGGQSETIQLSKFDQYYRGPSKLDGITISTYKNEKALSDALDKNKIIAAAGMNVGDNDVNTNYETYGFTLMSANMLFLKTTSPILKDVKIRQALIKATNVPYLTSKIGYPTVPVREPLLKGQVGYNPLIIQLGYNKAEAIKLLDSTGWVIKQGESIRTKDGKKLSINLAYENSHDFLHIAPELQKQWSDIGVDLIVNISKNNEDSRKYIDSHDYDVLLYGISIGPDPDVYAYWHSSQFDQLSQIHLNLSEYKSNTADLALEAARTRYDVKLRTAKYKPFLEAWRNDVPAIGLYQPRYLYISNQHIYGLTASIINIPSDRFNSVNQWMIKTEKIKT